MAKQIVNACRDGLKTVICLCGEAFSLAVICILALAPVAGAVAITCLPRNWVMVTAILAIAGIGAAAFGRLGSVSQQAIEPAAVSPRSDEKDQIKVMAPSPARLTNDLVSFHDFDRDQGRFDHW